MVPLLITDGFRLKRARQVPDNQSLPSTNEVWSKVIFLHLSVSHSVHGGRIPACNWWAHRLGRHPPGKCQTTNLYRPQTKFGAR